MALRGIGANPLSERGQIEERAVKPWEEPGLSRADRVIASCEDLPITAGQLAGSQMELRSRQRDFIKVVYAEDANGLRPVRTVALALCHLLGPESEPRSEVYSCALIRDQAAKLFAEMVAILNGNDELSDRCNVVRLSKQVEVLPGPFR